MTSKINIKFFISQLILTNPKPTIINKKLNDFKSKRILTAFDLDLDSKQVKDTDDQMMRRVFSLG